MQNQWFPTCGLQTAGNRRAPSEGSPGGNQESRAAAGRFKRAAAYGAALSRAQVWGSRTAN